MTQTKPNICVVVSAYNGERYIEEQLKSVFAQSLPPARVLVRDDGSNDGTAEILEAYERRGLIEFVCGKNLGVVGSFFELMDLAQPTADYIALCDQDDVWHDDKLKRAYEKLAGISPQTPALYCSEYVFCDAHMNPLEKSRLNLRGVDFDRMLYENRVSGNTCMLNSALAQRVVQAGRQGVYTHDWWLGLVACALGQLVFDDYASLDYRRTGSNASPTGNTGLTLLRYRIKTFFQKGDFAKITAQLHKLGDCFYTELSPSDQKMLDLFLQGGRLKKACARMRLRQEAKDELALRILFLMGKL